MRKPRPELRFVAAALALALAPTAPAIAAEVPPQRIGPGVASSVCIGETTSPRCAADTLLACFARAQRALCERVGAAPPDPMPAPRLLHFVLVREGVIRAAAPGAELPDLPWFRPGVTLLELNYRACPADETACGREPWEELQIYLRRAAAGWQVIHWHAPGDADQGGEFPDAFRPPAD